MDSNEHVSFRMAENIMTAPFQRPRKDRPWDQPRQVSSPNSKQGAFVSLHSDRLRQKETEGPCAGPPGLDLARVSQGEK